MIDAERRPRQTTEPDSQGDENDERRGISDERHQEHEEALGREAHNAEYLAHMGVGHFAFDELVGHVAGQVEHFGHDQVGQTGPEAGLVNVEVENVGEKCGHLGEHGVEAPVLGEMRKHDGPNWQRPKYDRPWNFALAITLGLFIN